MQHIGQRIVRNTAWFTAGSISQKLVSFAYFSLIAMTVGVEGTGKYFFALTYTALFAVAADWGIAPVLTREIAKDHDHGFALVLTGFLLKAGFALITALVLTGLAHLLGYDADTRLMIGIATAAMLLDSIHLGCYGILRGLQRVHYEAMGLIVHQVVLATAGVVILTLVGGLTINTTQQPIAQLQQHLHPAWLLVPYLFASAANLSLALFGCIREQALPLRRRLALPDTRRWLLRTATPFAVAGGLARIYTYVDTIILSLLATPLAVGYYSTPFKITFAFQFIPLAFMGALYPAMSAVAAQERGRLTALFEQSLRALIIIVLPIAFGIGVLADVIIPSVYGATFTPSVIPLRILMVALPFIFANFPAGHLLNAVDRQLTNTKLLAFATSANVVANLILIPPFAATGAALSALLSTVMLFALNLIAVRRAVRYRVHAILDPFIRTAAAALCMSAAILLLHELSLLPRILIGMVAYPLGLFAFRAVRWDDLRALRAQFQTPQVSPS